MGRQHKSGNQVPLHMHPTVIEITSRCSCCENNRENKCNRGSHHRIMLCIPFMHSLQALVLMHVRYSYKTCTTQPLASGASPCAPAAPLRIIPHPERAEQRQRAAVQRGHVHKAALIKQLEVLRPLRAGRRCRLDAHDGAGQCR